MKRRARYLDEPTMSDKTLLLNVEDLINMAFGTLETNVVNFKLVQSILHILARQMRLLEQNVEIKFVDDEENPAELQEHDEKYERDAEYYSGTTESEVTSDEEGGKKYSITAGKKAFKETDGRTLHKVDRKLKKEEIKPKQHKRTLAKDKNNLDKYEKKSGEDKEKAVSEGGGGIDEHVDSPNKRGEKDIAPQEKDKSEKGKHEKYKTKNKKGTQRHLDTHKNEHIQKEGVKGSRRQEKGGGISISEEIRKDGKSGKDKILVVEKGPTTRDSRTRVGSIEVVTRSEFHQLESAVEDLASLKGPLPMPTMPDDNKLKSALVKGTASLPETMGAMQVNARILAAEKALTCMADLLTRLAAAGAIPPDLADSIDKMKAEVEQLSFAAEADTSHAEAMRGTSGALDKRNKSVGIDPFSRRDPDLRMEAGAVLGSDSSAEPSDVPTATITSKTARVTIPVTYTELEEALQLMKTELLKNVTNITAKDCATAERASIMANSVAEKLDVALKLDDRINALYSLTSDYVDQLNGFDSGVASQMQSFQEQMMQMREDLKEGIAQMGTVNNNAETTAVAELKSGYDTLVIELDTTVHTHSSLVTTQHQLAEELRDLIEWVEMLREQKADRDEVMDGLRDKADLNRLNGLLSQEVFEATRMELNKSLELCYEKFQKQDSVWMGAIKDLSDIAGGKAELIQLMSLRDHTTENLKEIRETIRQLEIMLGEPQAAMIMRQISRGAHCGACLVPALMQPQDAHYGAPAPLPPLPLHDHQSAETEPCTTELKIPAPPDARQHICRRWVGGSHTLVSEHITREKATPTFEHVPSRRYAGYGSDGRLYMLEEELQPCVECNQQPVGKPDDVPPPSEAGDGDYERRGFAGEIIYEGSLEDTGACECCQEAGSAD